MESVTLAAIAVAETLLGSTVTYVFQQRTSGRVARFSFQQQLRSERMTAYSDFAGAIVNGIRKLTHFRHFRHRVSFHVPPTAISEFRRGQLDRWYREEENPDSRAYFEARLESYRLRSAALHALARVQLVAPGQTLAEIAVHAYDLTSTNITPRPPLN